jgi:formylglycine-generating enzyme required for sulfatase activity
VYNLENGDCQDVTRADLLNGKMGTIETDYTKFTGYSTPVSDVIIWTEVTNDVKYATTHIVLRKIPAKGQTFTMGSPESEYGRTNTDKSKIDADTIITITGRETQHEVSFSRDYYMGVFEVTQYQYWRITGKWPSAYSLEEFKNERPVEKVTYDDIRGTGIGSTWPTNDTHEVHSSSFLGLLRSKIEGSPKLDLPTEAQWEYACRANSTKSRYNGCDCSNSSWTFRDSNLNTIARYNMNGGYINDASILGASMPILGTTNGTARVGTYLPNAYGLYDTLGNVAEWCLDWFGMFTSEAETDPKGPAQANAAISEYGYYNRSIRGVSYGSRAADARAAFRNHNTWSKTDSFTGFRLCLTVEE